MKKQADEILHEVRSKQDETSKALELLNAIAKLRNIRKTAAENTGNVQSMVVYFRHRWLPFYTKKVLISTDKWLLLGVYPVPTAGESEKFEQLQSNLEKLLTTQMESYKEEQKVLEVIIGNETAAQKEREALQCKYRWFISLSDAAFDSQARVCKF